MVQPKVITNNSTSKTTIKTKKIPQDGGSNLHLVKRSPFVCFDLKELIKTKFSLALGILILPLGILVLLPALFENIIACNEGRCL